MTAAQLYERQRKALLAIKFPTHVMTTEEGEYHSVMGRGPHGTVDVTLKHNGNTIHCNDTNDRED